MKRILILCFILLFLGCNIQSFNIIKQLEKLHADATFVDSFLKWKFHKSVSIGAPIVIMQELFDEEFLSSGNPSRREKILDEAKKKNQKLFEAVNDFCIKNNRTTNNLKSIGTLSVKHVVMNEKQILEILSGGWKSLQKKYNG